MLKDVEISRLFGVPTTTIRDWKKYDKNNWRKKIYMYLKIQDKDEVLKAFDVVNKDFKI